MKKIYQHILNLINKKYFFYFIISIIVTFLIFINTSFFQNKIAQYILLNINNNYKTNILIDNISINLFVGNIKIRNIKVLDKKMNILIFIPKIEGNINIFNFFFRKINIKNIIITNPKINIITYKNDYINNITYFFKNFKQKTNKINYNFYIKNFSIQKAYIHILNNNKYIKLIFKGYCNFSSKKIIIFNKLIESYTSNLILKGAYINKNIFFNFNSNNLFITNKKLIIYNNNFIFNNSKIMNSFSLFYKKYNDLLTFSPKVFFNFIIKKGSYISSNDINLFINNNFFKKKLIIYINCNIRGIFNKNIYISNIEIKNGKNIIKSKNLILYKKKNNIHLYFKKYILIKTSFFDIKKILPIFFIKKIPTLLNNYGNLKYYGSLSINYKYIKLNGYFTSSKIGIIRGNIFFFNLKKLKNIKYQGKLYIYLYNLLEKNKIKYINAEIIFYGEGFLLKNNHIKLYGIIKNIFLYNKKIQNININGYILNNSFYGIIDINDNNINIKFNGIINFYTYRYFLHGEIKSKYFYFINDKIFNKLIYGQNINIFIFWTKLKFNIYLNNIYYKYSNNILFIPKIYLGYKYLKEKNKFLILSVYQLINLSFFGNFKWIELYKLLITNINKLLNNKEYHLVSSNQVLYFKIKITNNFINIFNKKNYLFYSEIIGILSDKKLIIYGKAQIIKHNYFFIKNINFVLNTNKKYNSVITIDSISYKEINIKNINVSTLINNNFLLIKIYFYLNIYNLNQELKLNFFKKYYYLNGIKYLIIGLSRSLIKINNNNLWLNENNHVNYNIFKIDLKRKKIIINELNIDLNNKKINIFSKNLNNKYNILQGIFNNSKITSTLQKCLFLIEKYNSIFIFEIKFKIHNININNIYIQNIKINIHNINNKYKIFLIIKNKKKYRLYISGYIKKKKEFIKLKFFFNKFPIIFFKKFFPFSDLRGRCNGIINLIGDYNNINYKGYLYIKNLGIKINNLNTNYESIYSALILFKNKIIILKNLIIRDTKYNSIGYLNGIITNHHNKWILSIYIDSKHFLVFDTTKKNNKLIYGRIFAQGKVHLLGDINNLNINVTKAKISNYSKLFINTYSN